MAIEGHLVRASFVALALAVLLPGAAAAQNVPGAGPVMVPTPAPIASPSGSPLPYPAYGSPAPDLAQLVPRPGVPTSISLPDAVRIAVATSPVFASQNAQYRAIHAKYTSEQQAIFPGIAGSATVQKQYGGTSTSRNGASIQTGVSTSESAQITLQQLIFDGGRTIAAIRSAKESDIAGHDTLVRQLETLGLDVANAYYAVLQDNATVASDAQLVREFQTSEAAVSAQIRSGAAARSDLAAAQFQTAQSRGNLVTAQGAAIGAQGTFATTLGLEADTQVLPQSLLSQSSAPNPTYALSLRRALAMRPDYLAAAHTAESAKEGVRYAKLARFPVLTGSASDGFNRLLPLESQYQNVKSLGLSLSIPIYDQGQTNYNVAVAAAQRDEAIAALYQTKLQVESDVRSALASLISARALLVQTAAELASAQVTLAATQAQYRVGASTVLNVVTAEANLATAQSDDIHAIYGVQTAQQTFLYATGVSDVGL